MLVSKLKLTRGQANFETIISKLAKIGELAKRSGVSVPTIRFYEEKELIWGTNDG
jgi:hypothetical protein